MFHILIYWSYCGGEKSTNNKLNIFNKCTQTRAAIKLPSVLKEEKQHNLHKTTTNVFLVKSIQMHSLHAFRSHFKYEYEIYALVIIICTMRSKKVFTQLSFIHNWTVLFWKRNHRTQSISNKSIKTIKNLFKHMVTLCKQICQVVI